MYHIFIQTKKDREHMKITQKYETDDLSSVSFDIDKKSLYLIYKYVDEIGFVDFRNNNDDIITIVNINIDSNIDIHEAFIMSDN